MKRINKVLAFFVCLGIFFLIVYVFKFIPFSLDKTNVGKFYLSNGASDTGAANLVTSVVLGFRGFDTLGEVLVLFLASLGVGIVLGSAQEGKEEKKSSSLIMRLMADLLFPFILLLGTYIFIQGHLTPGGGFQGGAVYASGFLLIYLVHNKKFRFGVSEYIESFSGLVFVGLGILGLIIGGAFLINFLSKGELTHLFSAGIIPIIYIFIGVKVGSELSSIIYRMMK